MRLLVALLMVFGIAVGTAAIPTALTGDRGVVVAAQQQGGTAPSGKVDVNIDVNRGHGGAVWWANPVWIAIGAIAVVLLIVILALAFRGGGTTVIRS